MSFAWPWLFVVLPWPWLVHHLLKPVEIGAALRVPGLPVSASPAALRSQPLRKLAILAWLLLVIAAARPQIAWDVAVQPVRARSVMLAFDVSASMATADLRLAGQPVDRLRAARVFADEFLQQRAGDRVGLIVFGSQAYLHTPLTFDLQAVREALAGAEVGLAGRETALGDAIALGIKHLQGLPDEDRVLVVLTDGGNTAGTLAPQRAAWLARREGVRIHSVGIGAGQSGSEVDEESLRGIAEQTGGTYLRATDSAAVADFWQRLQEVEPTLPIGSTHHPLRELYPWPLGLALLLAVWLILRRMREFAA